MSPVPQFLTNTLEKVFFRPAVVSEVNALSGHFREVEFSGESLKGEKWVPGQKVQFHLGNLMTRTYTPISWNAVDGSVRFILFLHENGPGSTWAASLKKGDQCQFMGPRSSLNLAGIKNPSVFFGDETSIGAAQALQGCGHEHGKHQYVLEVSSLIESQVVLESIGLTDVKLVQRTAGNAHLDEVEQVLLSVASRLSLPQWVFTGKAQSIQTLRKLLNARRVLFQKLQVKAYWAEGKTGLD